MCAAAAAGPSGRGRSARTPARAARSPPAAPAGKSRQRPTDPSPSCSSTSGAARASPGRSAASSRRPPTSAAARSRRRSSRGARVSAVEAPAMTAMPQGFTPVVAFDACFDARLRARGRLGGRRGRRAWSAAACAVRDELLTGHGLRARRRLRLGGRGAGLARDRAGRHPERASRRWGSPTTRPSCGRSPTAPIDVEARVLERGEDAWCWTVEARDDDGAPVRVLPDHRRRARRCALTCDISLTVTSHPCSLLRVDDQLRRRSVGAPAARSVLLTLLGEYVLPLPRGRLAGDADRRARRAGLQDAGGAPGARAQRRRRAGCAPSATAAARACS